MKLVRLLAGAALFLPAITHAQTSRDPRVMVQVYRMFADQYRTWLGMAFDSIPASKYGYRPTPAQLTVGNIAQHLEHANYRLCAHFSDQRYVMSAKDSLADSIKARWPKDTLVVRLKASLEYCDSALARLSDVMLTDSLPLMTPNTTRTAPRVRFLLLYVTDLADHWSQIANYMRLNNMIPPSALPQSAR